MYKVMMVEKTTAQIMDSKVATIVASSEEQAMQHAELRNPAFKSRFAMKMFTGSPTD